MLRRVPEGATDRKAGPKEDHMPKTSITAVLAASLAAALYAACGQEPLSIAVGLEAEEPEYYQMLFPPAADIDVDPYEYASAGDELGATIVRISIASNRDFSITGARVENLAYEIKPINAEIPALANPSGAGWVPYSHFDVVNGQVTDPVSVAVPAYEGSAVIHILKDATASVIEIYPKTRLGYWADLDTDRDGIDFIDDDTEVIDVRCSIFLEGYLEGGTEFTGSFPGPLGISLQIRHNA
jgi:hypothetical protein